MRRATTFVSYERSRACGRSFWAGALGSSYGEQELNFDERSRYNNTSGLYYRASSVSS